MKRNKKYTKEDAVKDMEASGKAATESKELRSIRVDPSGIKTCFNTYDVKEGPDWDRINACISEVFDGQHLPVITMINSQSDWCVLVMSSIPISEDRAKYLCEEEMRNYGRR
jgi:hypothetical protein